MSTLSILLIVLLVLLLVGALPRVGTGPGEPPRRRARGVPRARPGPCDPPVTSAYTILLLAVVLAGQGCGATAPPFWWNDVSTFISAVFTPLLIVGAGILALRWKRAEDKRVLTREKADKEKADRAAAATAALLSAQEATQRITALAAEAQIEAANKAAADAKEAAAKVAKVAADLAVTNAVTNAKLDAVKTVADKTHALTNNTMGIQLRAYAIALREIADRSGTPGERKAADDAERRSVEHDAGQAGLDAAVAASSAASPEVKP